MKVTEKALQETVQEFDIWNIEQKVNAGDLDILQTTYWDSQRPHVLRWKSTDVEKARPESWTRSCQFLLGKEHLRIETSSSSGKVAWWIYERQ